MGIVQQEYEIDPDFWQKEKPLEKKMKYDLSRIALASAILRNGFVIFIHFSLTFSSLIMKTELPI